MSPNMSMTSSALLKFGIAVAFQPGMAVAIVALAFLRIAEDFVGLGRLLELGVRLGVADVAVGVILHGQLAIGLLDLLVVGASRQTPRTS